MLFIRNELKGTVFRPLFFEFYDDETVFKDEILDT